MTQTSSNDKANPPPENAQIAVDPKRLGWGEWNHEEDRQIGEGDISRSYSADTIAMSGKIRALFKWQGQQMVNVGMSGRGGIQEVEAYRAVPKEIFTGCPTTYAEKVHQDGGDTARADPLGFYHAMQVSF